MRSAARLCLCLCALSALGGCSQEFTDAYTQTALSANAPDPERQMNDSLRRTGENELRGVDTTQLQSLK